MNDTFTICVKRLDGTILSFHSKRLIKVERCKNKIDYFLDYIGEDDETVTWEFLNQYSFIRTYERLKILCECYIHPGSIIFV